MIKKYNLQYNKYNVPKEHHEKLNADLKLQKLERKWNNYIIEGYNGICLPVKTPLIWCDVIDDFLEFVKEKDPNFKIYNIKLLHGGLMISIKVDREKDELYNINLIASDLEKQLFHKDLIN